MKKRELMKRGMALFLAATLTVGSTVTVFADDVVEEMSVADAVNSVGNENVINSEQYDKKYELDILGVKIELASFDTDVDAVPTDKEEFHNNEAALVRENSESVQAMESEVVKAQAAAKKTNEALEDLEEALETLEDASVDAETAKNNAEEAKTNLETADLNIASKISAGTTKTENAETAAKSYNDKVEADQEKIDNTSITTKETDMQGYVEDANEKLEEANKEFQAALESDELDDETLQHINNTITACQKVITDKNNAYHALEDSQKSYDDAKEKYNLYAMAYGLPLYGKSDVTYTVEEATKALLNAGLISEGDATQAVKKNDINGLIEDVNNISLDDEQQAVKAAKDKLDTARSNYNEAKEAANNAKDTIEAAAALIDEKAGEAEEASNNVKDYVEEALRDAYLEAAGDVYSQEFVDRMIALMKETSDLENQLDYERALNEWANDSFNTWHLLSKTSLRNDLNNQFIDDFWERFFNTPGFTQWIVTTDNVNESVDKIKAEYSAIIEDYIEELCIAEANWADVSAKAAKDAKDEDAEAVATLVEVVNGYNTNVEAAEEKLVSVKENYDEAVTALVSLKARVNALELKGISLDSLKEELAQAEGAIKGLEEQYKTAEAASESATNLKNLATKLKKAQTTRFFAQITEAGEYAVSNGYEYDLTDGNVKSRGTEKFSGSLGAQEIPYSMYKDYVQFVYEKQYSVEKQGQGIALNENSHSEEVLYWELDEDGTTLTGKRYTLEEIETLNPETGKKYFLGYVLKWEADGYHIDGFVYNYEHVDAPVVDETPEGGDIPAVGDIVIIDDAPVALAAAPAVAQAEVAPINGVLGARRSAENGSVLGAKRAMDQAVLGKRRAPETGDSMAILGWIIAMVASAGIALVSAGKLKKISK